MNIEDLNVSELRGMEAEIKARRDEVKPTFQHYGSAESLSDSELRGIENEIKARRDEIKPIFQHYGSIESLSDSDIQIQEAQVAEKRKQDIPHQQYLNELINNPNMLDENVFKNAVEYSMQRNGIVIKFMEDIFEKISSKTYELKAVNKEDSTKIEQIKMEIEKLINIYTKYLYTLKTNGWNFNTVGVDLNRVKMPDDIKEDLWQVEKQFNFNFQMPIPADLGDYYGHNFERKGKMIPGLTFMYQDLVGKEVNWHQILIYKENELTPKQRYEMRQAEKLKIFEQARQEEIINNLQEVKTINTNRSMR